MNQKEFERLKKIVSRYEDYYQKLKSPISFRPRHKNELEIPKKLNKKEYDEKTQKLIVELYKKYKNSELNEIDTDVLQKLIDKEIDYYQIEEEKNKCKKDPLYFVTNYIWVPNKYEQKQIKLLPDRIKKYIYGDKVKFVPYAVQYQWMETVLNSERAAAVKSRQVGFTNSVCALALQLITFQNNKRVMLFSKAQDDAKKTLNEYVKFPYNNLPFFLRRKVYRNIEGTLALGNEKNASYMYAQTSGRKSGRSASATWLILDEAEFIDGIDSLQAAAAPTLSATRGKAIVLSTPQQYGSQFYKLIKSAEEENSEQKLVKGYQKLFPDRDEEQYKRQCEALLQDRQKIKTELEMEQIVPFEIYIPENVLMSIKIQEKVETEKSSDLLQKIKSYAPFMDFYIDPSEKERKNDLYVIAFDPYEGGGDKNAICVVNLNEQRIAAIGETKLEELTDTLYLLSAAYNNAKIAIERNKGYKYIRDFINDGNEHLLLPHIGVNKNGEIKIENKKGFYTDQTNKRRIIAVFNEYIMEYKELPEILYEEAKYLVIKKGAKIEGLEGDDAIMAASIALQYAQIIRSALSDTLDEEYKHIKNVIKSIYSQKGNAKNKIKKMSQLIKDNLIENNKSNKIYDLYFQELYRKITNSSAAEEDFNKSLPEMILEQHLIREFNLGNPNKSSKTKSKLLKIFNLL